MTDAPQAPAGWYPDSTDASRLRYWDGTAWTDNWAPAAPPPFVPEEATVVSPIATNSPEPSVPPVARTGRAIPTSTWVVGAVLLVVLLIALFTNVGSFLLLLGLAALGTGVYVFFARKRSWALLPATRGAGAAVLGAGLVVVIVGAVVIGATSKPVVTQQASAALSSSAPTAVPTSTAATQTVKPTPTSSAGKTTVVPNVVGMKGDKAQAALKAAGLVVDWSEAVVKAGNWTVDAQVPAAGAEAALGAKIRLTVSKHPDPKPTATAKPTASAKPAAPAVPAEYTSALSKAGNYSDTLHMSKAGLYDQLTSEYGEQFSAEAAQYAVDNVKADWKANALAKAKDYQESMSMSPEAIRDQLTSEYGEKFTADEAAYAIDHLNG